MLGKEGNTLGEDFELALKDEDKEFTTKLRSLVKGTNIENERAIRYLLKRKRKA